MKPDLRLFGFALGTWAACAGALWMSAASAWWCATSMAGLLLVVVSGWRWRRRRANYQPRHLRPARAWTTAALLLGGVCGCTMTAAHITTRDVPALADLARKRSDVRVELVVTDDPHRIRSSGPGPATYVVPARLERLETATGTVRLSSRVVVFSGDPAWPGLLPSQRVVTAGRLGPPRGGDLTAATLTASGAPDRIDSPSWTHVAAGALRAGLRTACAGLPSEPGGLLPGLVLGDTSRLDPALADDFRTTGLTHLVAVSGANVAILLGVVLFLARWCRCGPVLAAIVCAVALAGFVVLVRPSPSVVRAAAMGAVGLLALASGRSRTASAALAAAVVVALLIDPQLAVDPGFALSVLATGALVLVAPRWRDALRARGVPAGVAEAVAVPAAAQVVCAPVIAGLSGQVGLVAVPANLLAAPAVAPATVLGVGSAVVSPWWPDGAAGLAWVASWPARWLVTIAHVGSGVPAGSIPWSSGLSGALLLAAVTVAVVVVARRPVGRRFLGIAAVAAIVATIPVRWATAGWPPTGAVVVVCDVGQGDAIVVPDGGAAAVVVDTGPDPVPVDRCLRRLGVHTVTVLVITHFHADHIGGVAGVWRDRQVTAVVLPTFDEPAVGEAAVRAAAGSTPVAEAGPGWSYRHGSLVVRALGPGRAITGTRSDPNNNSLLLLVDVSGVRILLAGDAETEEQHALLAEVGPDAVRADVLKLAHHGSSYQDSAFLDAVRPRVALVSVGADNRYGHPNAAVLDRLRRSGAAVLRTDTDGDLAVVVTPTGLATMTRR